MPRRPRIAVPNYPYHIVQRGHDRRIVFVTDRDRMTYLATLREFRLELGLKLYAYCLMPNHVHLVIDPGDDATNLSLLMKRLAGRHTRRINRLDQRTGTSWDGRFKCSLIESDRYLLACTRYVDLNPVRAGLVALPENYAWSSYRARIGHIDCEWLDVDPCFMALGHTIEQRQLRYELFVNAGIGAHELAFIRDAVKRNQLTARTAFVREMERRTGRPLRLRPRGRPSAEGSAAEK